MLQRLNSTGTTRRPSFRTLVSMGLTTGIALTAGCSLDTSTGPSAQAVIQFVNVAPNLASPSLFVDGNIAVTSRQYGVGSVFSLPPGASHEFSIEGPGTPTLATLSVEVNQQIYTFVATQHGTGAGLLVLPDTVSPPPTNDVAVRIVNTSPTAGIVDLYLNSAGSDTTLATPRATGTKNVLLDINVTQRTPGQVETILLVDQPAGGGPVVAVPLTDR
jgi:uncharacterized protein DUF4397